MSQYWDKTRTLGRLPDEAAARWGDREALTFHDRRWTFSEVNAEINRVARGLMALGIQPKEHVCIWLNNCPEWVFTMFAIARIGAVHIPVNTRFRTADLKYILQQSDCTTLITHDTSGPIDYLGMTRELIPHEGQSGDAIAQPDYPHLKRLVIKSEQEHAGTVPWARLLADGEAVSQAEVDARSAAVTAEDILYIMYTSGTTGFPKGVLRNHSLIQNQIDRCRNTGTTDRDVFLNYLPLFHLFGYVDGPMMSMLFGTRQIITETFDPAQAMDLVESEGVTQVHGFETHLKDLMDEQERRPRDISTLRAGIFAVGMQSAVPVAHKAGRVLAPMKTITAYGMTEIGQNATLSDLESTEEQRCETSGYPSPGYEVRVIDPETGQDQPPGIPGEIIVRTYNIMQGYYKKPEETAKVLDAEGWFHTGDTGYLREDGYLRFIGRYKDMLKIGGENVDPMEVEGHLLGHEGVYKVSVVGLPDERLTEVPVAFVQPRPGTGLRPQDVIDFCRGKIASFKIPRHVVFVEDFPMTASGKVQKVKLREQAMQAIRPD